MKIDMFPLNKAQKEIQKAAREFAKGEFDKDLATELDKHSEFPKKIWKKACDLGFIGLHFPEAYSGQDMALLDNVLVIEEFCRQDSSLGAALTFSGYMSECLMRFGSKELKEAFLPAVAEGQMVSGGTCSEPNTAHGKNKLTATAIKENDIWIINGLEPGIINGAIAGFYIVPAKTEAADSSVSDISLFLIERDRDGVTVKSSGEKLGLRMLSSADLILQNVQVPQSNLIGKENQGIAQLSEFNNISRIQMAAIAMGAAQGAFDRAFEYVKQRVQFGKTIAQFQVTRHKLAEMAAKIESARFLIYNAARKFDNDTIDVKLTAMAKLVACRSAVEVCSESVQLLGGYGYMKEYEVERFLRDVKSTTILGSNTISLKDIIANSMLGVAR